ncbi:MAG: copper chaperone PCu(A)C [Ignavibacteriaceae bacterium]
MVLVFAFLTFFTLHLQKVDVKNAWLRPADKGMNSALYFDVTNNSSNPDTLLNVSSNIAELVQLHESYIEKGMMGMREVKNVVIKPHSTFSFKEGGYHVMLLFLKKILKPNSTEIFFLHFKNSGTVKIKAFVKKG